MTTQEIMEMTFQQAGEPSDLCPYTDPGDYTTFDITRVESVRLLRIVNMAVRRIASWQFRNGRIVRHKSLQARTFHTIPAAASGTVVSATDTGAVIAQLGTDANDELNGWLVEIDGGTGQGQVRLITDSALAGGDLAITIHQAWDTNPDATSTYVLYKSFFSFVGARTVTAQDWDILLDPNLTLHDVMKVRDLNASTDLSPTMREEVFTGTQLQSGIPTEYRRYGNQLQFDVAVAERRSYEILYTRNPTALAAATQVPELLEIFHEAIILWGVHYIQRMNQAFGPAYATKRELEDFMEMVVAQGAADMDLELGGVTTYG